MLQFNESISVILESVHFSLMGQKAVVLEVLIEMNLYIS